MSEWKDRVKSSNVSNPRELIDSFEGILMIEQLLITGRLSEGDRDLLLKKFKKLLDMVDVILVEFAKFTKEPNLPDHITIEDKRYYFEPFFSYLNELMFYATRQSRIKATLSPFSKKRKAFMKLERKMFKDGPIFYKLIEQTLIKLKSLKNLQFRDQRDIDDKIIREELELILFVNISKYINIRLQLIILNKDEAEQLKILEEKISKYQKFTFILDKILQYSFSLENDNLN